MYNIVLCILVNYYNLLFYLRQISDGRIKYLILKIYLKNLHGSFKKKKKIINIHDNLYETDFCTIIL